MLLFSLLFIVNFEFEIKVHVNIQVVLTYILYFTRSMNKMHIPFFWIIFQDNNESYMIISVIWWSYCFRSLSYMPLSQSKAYLFFAKTASYSFLFRLFIFIWLLVFSRDGRIFFNLKKLKSVKLKRGVFKSFRVWMTEGHLFALIQNMTIVVHQCQKMVSPILILLEWYWKEVVYFSLLPQNHFLDDFG